MDDDISQSDGNDDDDDDDDDDDGKRLQKNMFKISESDHFVND